MRISEIKHCIEDKQVLLCVKNDFWEDEKYRSLLEEKKNLYDIHSIYLVIKEAHIKILEADDDKHSHSICNKKMRRLS